MANELAITQGATFALLLALENTDGSAYDTSTLTITSGLRTARAELVATMTTTATGVPGQLAITAATDTWPVGRLTGDFRIVITAGMTVLYSGTYGVTVTPAMTPAP